MGKATHSTVLTGHSLLFDFCRNYVALVLSCTIDDAFGVSCSWYPFALTLPSEVPNRAVGII